MLLDLPADVLLGILSHLRLPDISILLRTSKDLFQFISANSFSIYRSVAIHQFHVPSSVSYPDSFRYPPYIFNNFSPRAIQTNNDRHSTTWPFLCSRLNQLHNSWRGLHSSAITIHRNTGDGAVHRFKIDENAGFIISSSARGGIFVTDLDGAYGSWTRRKVLWSLPNHRVRPYAHCEYSHGYLVFDRFDSKEVWRLTDYQYYYPSDPSITVVPESQPDSLQHSSAELACAALPPPPPTTTIPRKGHFSPYALLRPPKRSRAFRFVYPYLLVAAYHFAYLFDVRSGAIVQQFSDIQDPVHHHHHGGFTLGDLTYVEQSPYHAFICGELGVRIYTLGTSDQPQPVSNIPAVHDNYGQYRYTIQNVRDSRSRDMNWILGQVPESSLPYHENDWKKVGSVLYRHDLVRERDRTRRFIDQIAATHVSPCGNYLVILLQTSRLLLIRNLLHGIIPTQTTTTTTGLYQNTIEIQLGRPSRFSKYLSSFENGRVAVATRNGIFIVIPPPNFFSTTLPLDTPPTVLRVHPLNDPSLLSCITCLQLTPTGLYVNWSQQCRLANLPTSSPTQGEEEREGNGVQQHYRRNIHAVQEEVFWSGLQAELNLRSHGDALERFDFVEEEVMFEESLASVVLSVDFVPT